jgi:signal transduction histidine kinase
MHSFMNTATPTQEFLTLLQLRDLSRVMEETLTRLIAVGGAEGGALFLPGSRTQSPRYLRRGTLPTDALHAIDQWERVLLKRIQQGQGQMEVPAQTLLPSRYTLIKLPLNNADTLVGNVCLLLPPGAKLHAAQFDHLRTLCAVAANMLDMLQSLESTRSRLDRMSLLYEMGQSLASTLDLQQLLNDTMELAAEAMQAQASTLMLVDPHNSDYLVFEVTHGAKGEQLQQYRMPKNQGVAGWVATHGTPVIANNPDHDNRFNRKVDLRTGFLTRNIICVPMKIKGTVIGVLQVLNKAADEGFDNEDLELLLTIASQAAVSVENARLYRNLRDEHDRIIVAQEEIRRELSRNLHDGAVQIIAAMTMSIDHAKTLARRKPELLMAELEELSELANRAMRDTRTILFQLRPVVLETQGVVAALEAYAERLNQERNRTDVVIVELPQDLPRLDPKVERTLFDIVQEAVGNARKHAHASRIVVGGEWTERALILTVRDDGVGFDVPAVQAKYERTGSLGLLNMRERAALIDADYSLHSQLHGGTEVQVRVPLYRA